MKKVLWIFAVLLFGCAGKLRAQTARFNFSLAAQSVGSGWVNVPGDPSTGVRSGTSNGITVSSVATANWAPLAGTGAAFDNIGSAGGTFFSPSTVTLNHWFQYSSPAGYNELVPQLQVSGLIKDSVYTLKMTASSTSTRNTNPTRYTVVGRTVFGYIDINTHNNTALGATFNNVLPDENGMIKIYVNTLPTTQIADISGLQITMGRTNPPPIVQITSPDDNDVLDDEHPLVINATASETGGTISKVMFYIGDTTKIGESTTAPYSATWANPDPGQYKLTAVAVDAQGVSNSYSITVNIETKSSSWSTTGNIATGGDTNFVGTVDTNRLAFRTNNVERMSISKDGNVTIGGKDTASHPAFRVYRNGDLAAGTTMDRSVNTTDQVGMRYYSKTGMLQIGASDRLDTTQNPIVYGTWPSSGIIVNTDNPNTIKGKLMNTFFAGDANTLDTLTYIENAIIATENSHFATGIDHFFNVIVSGYGMNISAPLTNSLINGNANQITKAVDLSNINGFVNTTDDVVSGSLVNGGYNHFGGNSQLVAGQYLINRSPMGTTLGNSNVDFATLPYTGNKQTNVPNIDQYPLLALGNSANATGTIRSNALTVLYNGRTQINTTGHTNALTQANVTPAAALDVVSTNTGVLLPRLTNAQRNAIVAGDLHSGLLLYNTDSSLFQYYNGSAWSSVGAGGSGSSGRWLFSTGTNGTVYDNDDNIAIGTNDAKGYRLAVKGSALFTKVQVVATANWPDYVFGKEYRLRKLEDLAGYIDKYHHLPEIVSAAKVGKDGFDLGANQAAILKKVEELTLYLIDENRRVSSQNNQLEEQNKKLTELEMRLQQQQRQIDELKALIKKK